MYNNIVVKKNQLADLESWEKNLFDFKYSLFLLPQWLEILEDESHKALYLDFLLDGNTVAKLSGLECDGGILKGKQLYFYAAPAFSDDTVDYFDECHAALQKWALENGFSRIVIGSYDQQNERVCRAKGFYPTFRYEYIVDFKNEEGGRFSTGFKKNFKKAEKLGVTFNQSDSSVILDKMLDLLGYTRNHRTLKYGSGYNPFYMKNIDEHALQKLIDNGLGKLYYTLTEGNVNSVQYNIEKAGKVYGLFMGSDGFAYKNGLPSFVDYNLISTYKDQGFVYYNPGGGPADEGGSGIEQYKKSMGATKYIFAGCTTNFLTYPQRLLNPLLALGRKLPSSDKGLIGFFKRFI
ncbi:MAG: GNAT family N-acetyltransferase [Breznakibacter sp.]